MSSSEYLELRTGLHHVEFDLLTCTSLQKVFDNESIFIIINEVIGAGLAEETEGGKFILYGHYVDEPSYIRDLIHKNNIDKQIFDFFVDYNKEDDFSVFHLEGFTIEDMDIARTMMKKQVNKKSSSSPKSSSSQKSSSPISKKSSPKKISSPTKKSSSSEEESIIISKKKILPSTKKPILVVGSKTTKTSIKPRKIILETEEDEEEEKPTTKKKKIILTSTKK
jgi:hypothetical protein